MPEDKVIKSGQFTLPRLFFLLLSGIVVFVIVATGRLNIGYILLTLVLCVLLYLIATDWGVQMEAVETGQLAPRMDITQRPAPATASPREPIAARPVSEESRARRKSSRQPKRRR